MEKLKQIEGEKRGEHVHPAWDQLRRCLSCHTPYLKSQDNERCRGTEAPKVRRKSLKKQTARIPEALQLEAFWSRPCLIKGTGPWNP